MSTLPRFVSVALLLLMAGVFLQRRRATENLPPHEPLALFPKSVAGWVGRDIAITAEVREVLGDGDFLLRVYENAKPQPEVNLLVAYIPSQRARDTLHSPQVCLPGAGWSPLESGAITISVPGQPPFRANRYIFEKHGDRQLVFYWYGAHGRAVASEYWAKYYLIADSIRLNRSDGSMVRLVTPMQRGESVDSAEQRLLDFSAATLPILSSFISR